MAIYLRIASKAEKVLLNKIIDRQMETNDLDKTLKRLSDIRMVKPSEEEACIGIMIGRRNRL